jgi:hypothetical protein
VAWRGRYVLGATFLNIFRHSAIFGMALGTKNSGAFQGVVMVLFLWHSIWSAPPLHHAAIGIGEDVVMSL